LQTGNDRIGHQERFPPPSLRDRCGFREGTFAGTRVNGRTAPIPDLPALAPERLAKAGDWDGVRNYEVKGSNSYSKMVARYRQDLLAVHAASGDAQ
jgi:hypothetical protein